MLKAVAILLAGVLPATSSELPLHVKNVVTVPNEYVKMMVGAIRCDSDGNAYLMPAVRGPRAKQLIKISPDGQKITRFDFSSVPELATALDYAIGQSSEVYVLGGTGGVPYIVTFDDTGHHQDTVPLAMRGLLPTKFAALGTSEFLVAGFEMEEHSPFTGVFNDRGQLIRVVSLKGDIEKPKPELGGVPPDRKESYDIAIEGSSIDSGPDGNVYLARANPTGPVFVISPFGNLRTIYVTPPAKAGNLTTIKADEAGRLAITFEGEPPRLASGSMGMPTVWIIVVDSHTGKEVARYFHHNFDIGNSLACYTSDGFTFVSPDENGRLRLVHAGAR